MLLDSITTSFPHGSTPVEWMAGIQSDADVHRSLRVTAGAKQ